jgi:2-phospho-L-lactate guanylyltransferase
MPPMTPFVVLVPVKPPTRGKSRLATLPDDQRAALADAFARDTIAAARAAGPVSTVMVVTDDVGLALEMRREGCEVLPDGVADDLNGSLVQAAAEARRRWPDHGVAALCGDLPALRPDDLTAAIAGVEAPSYVADHTGHGTTMYAVPPGTGFEPRFGRDSAQAHATGGATPLAGDLASLRLDVDDPADLARALLLGVGEHTARATGRA